MNRNTFFIRLFSPGGIVLLLLPLFYSCAFDTGLVTDEPLQLGNFSVNTSSVLSGYHHPRFALLWQSIDGADSLWDIGSAVPDTLGHGDSVNAFTGSFLHLPSSSIGFSNQYVIGRLWLSDDTSSTGSLTITYPADYEKTRTAIVAVRAQLQSALSTLAHSAQFTPSPAGVSDSFLVRTGQLYRAGFPPPAAPIEDMSLGTVWGWNTLLKARFQVLFAPNKWETFFNPNGGFSSQNFQISESGSDTLVSACQLARYQPKPGSEAGFEQALEAATLVQVQLDSLVNLSENEINEIWETSASFPQGQRFLGRSTQDFIVYFSGPDSLKSMDTAERASAFLFVGKGDLKVGFNFVHCDTVGNCRVLENTDPVAIQLADRTTPIIDFPKAMPIPFLVSPQPVDSADLVAESMQPGFVAGRYNGKYDCSCDTTIAVEVQLIPKGLTYNMEFLNDGILTFSQAADGQTYFSQDSAKGLSIQVQFVLMDSNTAVSPVAYSYKLVATIQDQTGHSPVQRFYFPYVRQLTTPESNPIGSGTIGR